MASKNTDSIVSAALMLFKRDGYENVSIRQICETAHVPRSSFYTVFSGKADIISHLLASVSVDIGEMLPEFIQAPNDFERIWLLSDAFLLCAEDYGPALNRAFLKLELEKNFGFSDQLSAFNSWLIQLLSNCQRAGIVKNMGKPEELIPQQLAIARTILYDWSRKDGAFPLRKTVRHNIEVFLNVKPEYRREV